MAESNQAADDLPRAALAMVTAAFLFAAMGETVKMASAHLSNAMVVFFRNAFGLVALLPWLPRLGARGLRTTAWREHLVRGLAGLAAMYCYFYAIAQIWASPRPSCSTIPCRSSCPSSPAPGWARPCRRGSGASSASASWASC